MVQPFINSYPHLCAQTMTGGVYRGANDRGVTRVNRSLTTDNDKDSAPFRITIGRVRHQIQITSSHGIVW